MQMREILVEIILEHIITDSVSVLVLPVLVSVLLETVIGQVDIVVPVRQLIGV